MSGEKECLFCNISSGKAPCHKVWENETHLAFLTIFPNTAGATVVIPKKHYPSYAFDLPDKVLSELVLATREVAKKLDCAFPDVGRTAMVFEGFGIDHVHSKLFPLHGTRMEKWKPVNSNVDKWFEKYEGYVSSHNGKRVEDSSLAALAKRIRHS
jgi:histidine triad (HIT) family protein